VAQLTLTVPEQSQNIQGVAVIKAITCGVAACLAKDQKEPDVRR
jgi:hypothetical protein